VSGRLSWHPHPNLRRNIIHIYERVKADIAVFCIFYLIVVIVGDFIKTSFELGYDDTDNKVKGIRSGMAVRTDHGTGCNYLESAKGALIPRLDSHGNHICKR
jgi:hypothetical protein